MPAQRVFLVFQAGEVFINGLEPNIFDSFRLPSSFFEICLKYALATVFLTGNSAERTQMTLLICKLFSNANEHMCSSLKSVKIATFAVDHSLNNGHFVTSLLILWQLSVQLLF